MKFTPDKYAVMYHGERHPVGVTFDIDPEDAEEMLAHGTVETEKATSRRESSDGAPETRRAPGRPRKN